MGDARPPRRRSCRSVALSRGHAHRASLLVLVASATVALTAACAPPSEQAAVPNPSTAVAAPDGPVDKPAATLCAEFPQGDVEGWWNAAPADENGNVIDDPALWPEERITEHPRVALVATDTGAVISTWDRVACGQDNDYQPALQEDWPKGAIVIVDMDTNELLGVAAGADG
jgi:hypothetical protein